MGLELHLETSALACAPTAWSYLDQDGTLRIPSTPQRRRKLVARAWSELAAVNLAAALETIAGIEAECMPLSMAQAGLQCALLQAISAALQDDTEAAARLVENAL